LERPYRQAWGEGGEGRLEGGEEGEVVGGGVGVEGIKDREQWEEHEALEGDRGR